MNKLIYLFTITFLFSSCKQHSSESEKTHQGEYLTQATYWYQQSAEMKACYIQTYNWAKICLKNNLEKYKGNKKTAVVLDIDETVLNNSPFEAYLIKNNIDFNHDLWKKWTDKKCAKALPGSLDFTNYAKSIGVEVIYISNRRTNELETTVENLKNENFPNAENKFVLLKEDTSNKTKRRNLVSENYEILLFVGDNLNDFSNDFAYKNGTNRAMIVNKNKNLLGTKYIVLPNPMYGEWEKALKDKNNTLELRKQKLNSFNL